VPFVWPESEFNKYTQQSSLKQHVKIGGSLYKADDKLKKQHEKA
jgi:hypothetical protein